MRSTISPGADHDDGVRTSLYVDAALLSFPGTANRAWREEIADALDRGREWLERLDVTIVGARHLTSEIDAAMHSWNARVLFSGAAPGYFHFVSTAALDAQPPYPDRVLLLHVRPRTQSAGAQTRLDKLMLYTSVRLLPCRHDVVAPLVGDDLEEVFADVARSSR